jgi:hypothetical protein
MLSTYNTINYEFTFYYYLEEQYLSGVVDFIKNNNINLDFICLIDWNINSEGKRYLVTKDHRIIVVCHNEYEEKAYITRDNDKYTISCSNILITISNQYSSFHKIDNYFSSNNITVLKPIHKAHIYFNGSISSPSLRILSILKDCDTFELHNPKSGNYIFPDCSIQSLNFNTNIKITPNYLPSTIKYLHLGNYFNSDIEYLPPTLHTLIINGGNQLTTNSLPNSLKVLKLENLYSHELLPGVLHNGITKVKFNSNYNHILKPNVFPNSLEILKFGISSKYNHNIEYKVLPPLLKKLVFSKHSKYNCNIYSSDCLYLNIELPDLYGYNEKVTICSLFVGLYLFLKLKSVGTI